MHKTRQMHFLQTSPVVLMEMNVLSIRKKNNNNVTFKWCQSLVSALLCKFIDIVRFNNAYEKYYKCGFVGPSTM